MLTCHSILNWQNHSSRGLLAELCLGRPRSHLQGLSYFPRFCHPPYLCPDWPFFFHNQIKRLHTKLLDRNSHSQCHGNDTIPKLPGAALEYLLGLYRADHVLKSQPTKQEKNPQNTTHTIGD